MSTFSKRFTTSANGLLNRRSLEALDEIVEEARGIPNNSYGFDALVARIDPPSPEWLAAVLAEMAQQGAVKPFLRVYSPTQQGLGIADFESPEDVPEQVPDVTGALVDVRKENVKLLFHFPAEPTKNRRVVQRTVSASVFERAEKIDKELSEVPDSKWLSALKALLQKLPEKVRRAVVTIILGGVEGGDSVQQRNRSGRFYGFLISVCAAILALAFLAPSELTPLQDHACRVVIGLLAAATGVQLPGSLEADRWIRKSIGLKVVLGGVFGAAGGLLSTLAALLATGGVSG